MDIRDGVEKVKRNSRHIEEEMEMRSLRCCCCCSWLVGWRLRVVVLTCTTRYLSNETNVICSMTS